MVLCLMVTSVCGKNKILDVWDNLKVFNSTDGNV